MNKVIKVIKFHCIMKTWVRKPVTDYTFSLLKKTYYDSIKLNCAFLFYMFRTY